MRHPADPPETSSPTALTCLVLQVIEEKEEASSIAVEGVHEVSRYLDTWKDIAAIFPGDTAVHRAVVPLYGFVLDFLLSAIKHLQAGGLKRFCRSIPATKSTKLHTKLDKLKGAAAFLDKVVRTRATRAHTRDLRTVKDELVSIRHVILGGYHGLTDEFAVMRKVNADGGRQTQEVEPFCAFQMNTFRHFIIQSQQEVFKFKEALDWLDRAGRCAAAKDVIWPADGTCQWLFSIPAYRRWLDGGNKEMLWVEGKPG